MSINLVIVDDEPYIRRFYSKGCKRIMPLITNGEYEIHEAQSGEGALNLILNVKPNFVLMDTDLGDRITGDKVCSEVRARYNGFIYIVGMSGEDCSASWTGAGGAGANKFLKKPFGMGDLKIELEYALNQ
jgi:DNA-binding response OmpR family regulator